MTNRPKVKAKSQNRPVQHVGMQVGKKVVHSLLDEMQDGSEYQSIVGAVPENLNLATELTRALREIETTRNRPCLCYVGNVVKPDSEAGIDATDDLPFAEMVGKIEGTPAGVDVLLATNGGSAYQISRFVNALRGRFQSV